MSSNHLVSAGRGAAAIGAVVALAASAFAFVSAPEAQAAPATDSATGSASAVDLRAGLNVGLLNKTADVPLNVVLNDVHAPADASQTTLKAKVDGVDHGQPFNMLKAEVAKASTTAAAGRSEGVARLAHAHVFLPGLALRSLVDLDAVTSKATCVAGEAPKASINFVGDVTVLGQKVKIAAGGSTTVNVPGTGKVTLDLAKKTTTSSSAAATALDLKVSVNPAKLNVADVEGHITLVNASCELPAGAGGTGGSDNGGATGGSDNGGSGNGGATGGSDNGGSTSGGTSTDGHGDDLAETGSSSTTPYLAGGAAVLIVAGGGAVWMTRRRKAQAGS